MYKVYFLALAVFTVACAGESGRNPALVAAEQLERKKPMLSPAGGTYYAGITVQVTNFSAGMELVENEASSPLNASTLSVTASRAITIRHAKDPAFSSTENYTIVDEIPMAKIYPPAGIYAGSVLVTATTQIQNARIEYKTGSQYSIYDPEIGILLPADSALTLRVCVASICGAELKADYSITPQISPPAPVVSADKTQILTSLARSDFNQKTETGLSARMDEAKLKVLGDSSLLPDASMRSRFLAQRNDIAAANACTTIARYLYVLAMRITESQGADTVLPDFADYYIRHIRSGDIATDSDGNFVWIMNGSNLVTPYLSAEKRNAFEYHRSSAYPTDFSLLQPVYTAKPMAVLMRDSSNAIAGTHTFAAVQTENGFIMIDTYFAPWNGVEARASAGQVWPYAYRFGPAGSRYLHYTYGY